jgi:hypothetical protein
LGVVVFSPDSRQLCFEGIGTTSRITQVFPRTNTRYILKVIKHIQNSLKTIAGHLSGEFVFEKIEDIQHITKKVLPVDNSSLFFTGVEQLLDMDIEAAVTYLYDRFIGTNLPDAEMTHSLKS